MFRHRPEHDRVKQILHKIMEEGEVGPYSTRRRALQVLAGSGYVEWCVLRTIGHDLLSPRGKKRLAELDRKFCAEEVPSPHSYEGGFVGSPIASDATRKMTDEQWLSAINKDWGQNADCNSAMGKLSVER